MNEAAQQRVRHQHESEELAGAALRAVAANARLHFEGGRLYDGTERVPVHAPHLLLQPGVDSLASYRGVADAVALRLTLSDASLHERLAPRQEIPRLLFEWLEQLRVESLAPHALPGLRGNVLQRYRTWSDAFLNSGATETSLGILLFAFSQTVWSRLTGCALPETVQDLLEPTRGGLAPVLGTALAGLFRWRHDQERYADFALQIAQELAERVQAEYQDEPDTVSVRRGSFALSLQFESDVQDSLGQAPTGQSAAFAATGERYRVYTQAYDTEVQAGSLVRAALLQTYRRDLDEQVARQGVNVARLARAFRAILAHPQRQGWRYGEEDGTIDGRRLAQLISSPAERRVFKRDAWVPASNAVVSFLVDCSGSMKQHQLALAIMMDILMRALGQAGVPSEILGFTTLAWNGGRAKVDWMSRGSPALPGRMNEVCHLVFKDADTSWRRARNGIAAMMKPDLYREGIDGEAVHWACQRLLERDHERRILIVLSDGCPMDTATNLANDDYYLDNHLRSVVHQYAASGQVDIIGLGVGLDLSPYYRRSLAIDLTDGLDNEVFGELIMQLAQRHPVS